MVRYLELNLDLDYMCPYSKHFGVNAHVKLATCLYNDSVIYDVFRRFFNIIVNTAVFRTFV